jgi:hypothetical protein
MIYITEMLRWGDTETHHYIIGAYTTESLATYYGEVEKTWRGGKYEYRIVPVEVGKPLDTEKVELHTECFK